LRPIRPEVTIRFKSGGGAYSHPHRRHQVGDEQHVDDDARAVLGDDRAFADPLGEVARRRQRLLGAAVHGAIERGGDPRPGAGDRGVVDVAHRHLDARAGHRLG
jgi:hypothetical protein